MLIFNRLEKSPVTIFRGSITSITEDLDKGLIVNDEKSGSQVFIPRNIERYQDIRDELDTWHPILPPSYSDSSNQ